MVIIRIVVFGRYYAVPSVCMYSYICNICKYLLFEYYIVASCCTFHLIANSSPCYVQTLVIFQNPKSTDTSFMCNTFLLRIPYIIYNTTYNIK
jgi:hypothetical protein